MKKALKVIKNILVWGLVVLAVCMMIFTILSVTLFNRSDRSMFGFKMYTVLSDSMQDEFKAGSIVFVKETDPSTLKEGDIISYISQDTAGGSFGEVITHKIRCTAKDANGEPGFITYGTTTGNDDANVVTYPFITGKYVGHIGGVGYFFQFLKTTPGYITCIFIPFVLIIIYQGFNCIKLFRRYKGEQMEEMQAEKDRLAAEREENARMIAELQALKEQIAAQTGTATPAEQEENAAESAKADNTNG